MAIFVDNYPYPLTFQYNNQNCEKVYWNNDLVWPDKNMQYFWLIPDTADSLVYDYTMHDGPAISKTVNYSFDGDNWFVYTRPVSLSAGQRIYLKSNNTDPFYADDGTYHASLKTFTLANDSAFIIGGNIMALFNNSTSLLYDAFHSFFGGTKVRDASRLILPAFTSYRGYFYMFSNCSSLISPPTLPAMTVKARGYDGMFYNCTSLVNAPQLPATTLESRAYSGMFRGCSSLVTPPTLPATEVAEYCYETMFQECTSLTTIPKLSATTLGSHAYTYMYYNCSGLKFSNTQTEECPNAFRIPTSGTATTGGSITYRMLMGTSGTFTNDPSLYHTYYTNATVI